jgi:hypothetical protein
VLKNSRYARFDLRSGTKYCRFGDSQSPIYSHSQLNSDFFNRLGRSPKFVRKVSKTTHPGN